VTRAPFGARRLVLGAIVALAGALASDAAPLPAQARAPVIQQRVRLEPGQPVGFHVLVTPDTVFVGQQATYEMGVFISESAQQRMRRNPEVVPAELRGVLAYDLGGPQSLPAITRNGVRSFPHVLQRALFPLAPGRLEIPASQLTYALPRSTSFFSREESATLRGEDVALVVRPLPSAGQPAGFAGAVGELALRAQLDAPSARVGEPLVLTVRVSGRGNVKLWPRPGVRASGATLVESGERVRVDTAGQYVRGSKEFDWLLTPEREGRLQIPVVSYPYFDPYAAAYRIATTDSVQVAVAAGEYVPVAASVAERDGLSLRRTDRGVLPPPWTRHPLTWALALLAPLPAVLRRRRHARVADADGAHVGRVGSTSHGAAGRSAAAGGDTGRGDVREPPRIADVEQDRAAAARRRLLDGLAERLATTRMALVEREALERRLRRRGVTRETTARVLRLVEELDAAAWAPASRRREVIARLDVARLDELLGAVQAEAMPAGAVRARPTEESRRGGSALALALALAGVAASAVAQTAPSPRFADAVAAFDAGEAATAASTFRALAEASPRHADAWANAGTAAWVAGDTVQAVRAWQRALRLEPAARDVRAQLTLLPSGSWQGVAAVAETRADLGALVALVGWCAAWMAFALAIRTPRRVLEHVTPRVLRGAGVLGLVVAGGGVVWQLRAERQRAPAALAVVAGAAPLRVAPGRDANVFGGTARGDVVRRGEQRADGATGEAWVAVTHADGRTGWMPVAALVDLE
jgi:tetratricopeptide (TPR) repeat protein